MQPENQNIEYKERLNDKLEREVVGFLNSKLGGELYIGVADDGTIIGIDNADTLQLAVADRIKNNILPSCLGLFDILVEEQDGKQIYLTGKEIITAMRPPKKKTEKQDNTQTLFTENGVTLQHVLNNLQKHVDYGENALTSIDLFSGCGGLTKGFSMAGIKSIFASDIDENAAKTFMRNFPETPFLCKSITDIEKDEVDCLLEGQVPDIIVGGPPASISLGIDRDDDTRQAHQSQSEVS